MKKTIKMVCLSLVVILLLSLASCADARPTIMSYKDEDDKVTDFSSAKFAFALAEIKGQILESYANYGDVSAGDDFWNKEYDGKTFAQANKEYVEEYCKMMLITEYFCNKYDLKLTDEASEKIDKLVEDAKTHFGGEDLLAIELAKYGISIEEMRNYYETYERSELLRDYWYGENGTMKVPESDVKAKFYDNYYKVDAMQYSFYTANESGQSIPFVYEDITDTETREYFDENYVKVKHILYMTVDTSQEPLSEEEVAQAEKDANDAYNAIISGEVTFDEKTDENQDNNVEYVFTYGLMADEFEKASFEMQPDDVRLVKTKFGYHIIKKFATTDEDYDDNKDAVKHSISKDRLTEHANKMFEDLKTGNTEFKDGGEEAEYQFMADIIVKEGDIDENILTVIKDLNDGEYYLYKMEYGYYIFKKVALNDQDLASYYATIEDDLITEAFYKYLQSFYDSVTVVQEELDKYDIVTTQPFPYFNYEMGTAQ